MQRRTFFALDLGPLADGSGAVAPVYRDTESFFKASYVTSGLKSLLEEVLKVIEPLKESV